MEERAAGLILFREDRGLREYLLIKNRRGGHWGFAKGHVEPGEDDLRAAVREVAEEVSITRLQLIPGFRTVVRYSYVRDGQHFDKEVVLFLARTEEQGRPSTDEVEAMLWLPFPLALDRITFAEQREALRQAEAWLNSRNF